MLVLNGIHISMRRVKANLYRVSYYRVKTLIYNNRVKLSLVQWFRYYYKQRDG